MRLDLLFTLMMLTTTTTAAAQAGPAAVTASPAQVAGACELIHLGDLPGGSSVSQAHGINRRGQVVGWSIGAADRSEAVVWSGSSPGSIADALPGTWSRAHAVNRRGLVVGVQSSNHAFRWQRGVLTVLDDLPGGSLSSEALGVNDAGVAVGLCNDGVGINSACVWAPDALVPTRLPAGLYNSLARAINNQGWIVGDDRVFWDRAVLWRDQQMIELLPNPSSAWAINDKGVVVGRSELGAFRWKNGRVSFLPSGSGDPHPADEANAINRAGTIVGSAIWSGYRRAAAWTGGAPEDLNQRSCVVGSGWQLMRATGINDDGWVVGNGTDPQGQTSAFLLKPLLTSMARR